jgi:anti-sigma-K factor RskA
MTQENCEQYQELLTAKALTALDAADARALNSHLETCADCRSEMIAWEDTVALIAMDAEPLEPSAELRERILASVRASKQPGGVAQRVEQAAHSPGRESKVFEFEQPRRNVWTPLRTFGAIAATVVFAALIISLVLLWRENQANRTQLALLGNEINQMRGQVDRVRSMGELMTSPEGHMAKLSGTNVAPGAHAMLAYDKNGHAMLMAKGLPAAPEGMAYQLWFIKDNKKMPGKVFTTDAAGNGMLDDQIPEVARNAAVFAITLEPKSGVQAPTGSIYLLSSS